MNKAEIVTVLYELHKITGFRISLHGADYGEIAAYPEGMLPFCEKIHGIRGEHERCLECDRVACRRALESKTTHIYSCRFGLTEAVSPLYNFGTLTGFLMMGQVAKNVSDRKCAEAKLAKIIQDGDSARNLAEAIPQVSEDMVGSYVKIMTICAQYLTLSNAIPSAKPTVAELAKRYIGENVHKKICITDICDELGCSKSTLLTTFKNKYGITVNTYITEAKLGLAEHLLLDGDMTISEIAQETGFSDQSYFSKVFSSKYGTPPSEYRLRKRNR